MRMNMKFFLAVGCILAFAGGVRADRNRERPLQCWHCSSDTIGAEDFCDVDFRESSIPTDLIRERNISVVRNCSSTINSEHERPVCRKTVEEVNGKTVTKRFCYYTNKSDPVDHCVQEATEKNVRRVFCQDCLTDKCNSGDRQYAMMGGILLAALIAKLFDI